jgi:DNA-binding NarL/FixJ family response regulator
MQRQRCRILVVDDYRPILSELHRILAAEHDLEIIGEANDGYEAIKLVADCKPDVVLLDIHMPKMNGIEAANLIKKSRPETVILGLCGVKDTYMIEAFLKAGAVAVVAKDSIDQLISTIRRACPDKTAAPLI